jgi:hypothetical protein
LTQAQVRQAIESTCTKLSGYSFSSNSNHPNGTWNSEVGHGLVNAYAALQKIKPTISGPSTVCSGTATFTVSNAPANYTWGYSSSLTLVSTSGNTATFSKSGSGGRSVYASIIVGGTTVATKNFFMGGAPDVCNDRVAESDCESGMSVDAGCANGYRYAHITNSSSLASSAGTDQFEWRSTVSSNFTIEPYPSGSVNVSGDKVRVISTSGNSGSVEIRAHNACGWSDWTWGAAFTSSCGSTYSATASPNPVSATLNISITPNEEVMQSQNRTASAKSKAAPVYEIRLFNNVGAQVFQTTSPDAGSIAVNVSALPNGVYILYIHDGSDNPPQTQNIIVAH